MQTLAGDLLTGSAMPKIVDWDAQRDEILSATWRVIARDGITGATIRAIAREAELLARHPRPLLRRQGRHPRVGAGATRTAGSAPG